MIRASTVEDAVFIASNMREADRREFDALFGFPPELILPAKLTVRTRTWVMGGEPVAMGSIEPSIPNVGIVWLTGTDAIKKHSKQFLLDAYAELEEAHEEFPILTNLIDARNTLHIKWLKRMGFTLTRTIERWGARSVPFIEFVRFKDPCASS